MSVVVDRPRRCESHLGDAYFPTYVALQALVERTSRTRVVEIRLLARESAAMTAMSGCPGASWGIGTAGSPRCALQHARERGILPGSVRRQAGAGRRRGGAGGRRRGGRAPTAAS